MAGAAALERALQALRTRGCIADVTAGAAAGLAAAMARRAAGGVPSSSSSPSPPPSVYAGFDPTAPSRHLGHASVIVMLARM